MSATKVVRSLATGVVVSAFALLVPTRARASMADLGIEGGIVKRSLSDTSYKTGFTWQLNAELGLLPFLMVGPYVNFAKLTPEVAGGDVSSISFRTIGLRAKLKIPVPGPFTPYGVAGLGWAHADFPDQTLTVCDPQTGLVCASKIVPSATANFAEFMLGGGAMLQLAGPLAVTAEFTWRPSTGYKNDTYEQQIQSQQTSAPDPSRNGAAWVGLLGLALAL
jgi:opacity protein-like surface antigen